MSLTPVLTYAAPRERCFQETGLCVAGAILAYWEKNGGLPVFGYPISPLATETVENWKGPVQWFERDRLEDHGRGGVLAGRLAAEVLEHQDRAWQSLPFLPARRMAAASSPRPDIRCADPFSATGPITGA